MMGTAAEYSSIYLSTAANDLENTLTGSNQRTNVLMTAVQSRQGVEVKAPAGGTVSATNGKEYLMRIIYR